MPRCEDAMDDPFKQRSQVVQPPIMPRPTDAALQFYQPSTVVEVSYGTVSALRSVTIAPEITVSDYIEQWLHDVRTRVSAKTFERYEELCRQMIIPMIGKTPLAKLKPI